MFREWMLLSQYVSRRRLALSMTDTCSRKCYLIPVYDRAIEHDHYAIPLQLDIHSDCRGPCLGILAQILREETNHH